VGDFLELFLCSGVVRILVCEMLGAGDARASFKGRTRVVFQGTGLVGLLELLLSSSWGNLVE
jgi:hypothetical protein